MEIQIKKIEERKYQVNGKIVQQDMDGNWVGDPTMSTREVSAFQQLIAAENASREYPQHPPITSNSL
jgi:malate synthase